MSYQSPPPPSAAQPLSPEADKQAAMWANIGGIIGFLPSLLIWLILKDRGPRTNVEAKEALNWQITWLLPLAWWVLNVIFSIIGGVTVNNGGSYRYPLNFRFIK